MDNIKDVTQQHRKRFYWRCRLTHGEAQHLVVFSVHGLPLLCARGVIFSIKSNSAQLKNDVPLSLKHKSQTRALNERRPRCTITRKPVKSFKENSEKRSSKCADMIKDVGAK